MKLHSRRAGFIETVALVKIVLVLLVVGYTAKQTGIAFDSKPKQEARDAKEETRKANELAEKAKKEAEEMKKAHDATEKANKEALEAAKKKSNNQAWFAQATKLALDDVEGDQFEVKLAKTFNDAGLAAGDPVTVEQFKEIAAMYAKMRQEKSLLSKELEAKKAEAAKDKARADTAEAKVAIVEANYTKLETTHLTTNETLVKTASKAAELAAVVEQKTGENFSLWDRLKAIMFLTVVILLGLAWVWRKLVGAQEFNKDLGGAIRVAKGAAADKAEQIEEKLEEYWKDGVTEAEYLADKAKRKALDLALRH